ncbi:beta-glucosidase BglX [Rhodothermus marinus]|uniref:beta-glucosidase BglX n=1 Tax=Rhodothermus marinus TaxID=29549 RepID=UPI0012BA495E|nr:beta-glucosidase BglX [Rhodothermus marinus]BBM68715.1 beta-glucosidase [Rhodothermus marinus]BBM71694.1 beta-glucosidase [Rhodothermus marinus]
MRALRLLVLSLFWSGWLFPAVAQPVDRAREDSLIEALLVRMTLEEKLGQLTLYNGGMAETGPVVREGEPDAIRRGRVGAVMNFFGAEAVCAMQRQAVEESRLGIPLLFALDVIHGFRTIFPVPLAEAATFDPALVEQAARVAAVEASAVGLNWTFAPMVDIARDARWGRIVEGSGEDPYLGAVMAAARVRGFQGRDLRDPTTILATAKHFAAYGAAEAGRDYNTVDVSERTLREVYLPPFEAAVRAGALSIMSAFNEIGGVPATANRWLLTDVLRNEWGFEGLVVSDWTAIWELLFHGIAADSAEAGRKALEAGVDMDMVSGIYVRKLAEEVRAGRLPEAVVDEAVRRVLRVKYRLGLFEDPYRYCRDVSREQVLLSPEHRRLAREVARKAIVLLKNEGELLPLADTLQRVAVIGALANDSASVLGPWAAAGRPEEAVTILEGIRAALPGATVRYAPGYAEVPPGSFQEMVAAALSTDTSGFAEAEAVARWAEVVILVLGEHRELSGEAASRASVELPGVQLELARRLLALGRPVVVVLMNGRPLAIPELAASAPAIVEAWFLGTEMGHAVADVLFGKASPGGRLPVSFPRATGQEPLYYNHKPTGRPPRAEEKYTSKYVDVPWTPLYPFGYGLTYTTFVYDSLRLSRTRLGLDDTLEVVVWVTNTGRRRGEEVVQLYVRDEVASVTRPVKELKGFARVELAPGETKAVRFRLPVRALRFWGLEGGWVVEPGWFTLWVGPSSAEGLQARFEVVASDS